MKEYKYVIELCAIKELTVKADSQEEADAQADIITTTQTIPVEQEDITEIYISDSYTDWDDEDENVPHSEGYVRDWQAK